MHLEGGCRGLEDTLCGRDVLDTRVRSDGRSDGSGRSFENRFNAVVCVRSPDQVDVQVDSCVVREASEELLGQCRREGSDHFLVEGGVDKQLRAPREVDGSTR